MHIPYPSVVAYQATMVKNTLLYYMLLLLIYYYIYIILIYFSLKCTILIFLSIVNLVLKFDILYPSGDLSIISIICLVYTFQPTAKAILRQWDLFGTYEERSEGQWGLVLILGENTAKTSNGHHPLLMVITSLFGIIIQFWATTQAILRQQDLFGTCEGRSEGR